MRAPPRHVVAAVGLALALGASGCSKLVMVRPDHDPTRGDLAERHSGVEVEGYVTSDGEYHVFYGWATARDDSLRLYGRSHQPGRAPDVRLPREQVKAIFTRRADAPATLGGTLVFLLGAATMSGILLAIVIASLGS